MASMHEQRRKQNVRIALLLGALALLMLIVSLPIWRLFFGTVGGG